MSNQKIVTESALSAIASDIKGAIQNIPRPMKFKGTLGVGGTITSLPAASSSNEGDTYTVITAGTYRGLVCVVGDNVSSTGTTWVKNPTASSLRGLNDTAINNPHDGQLLTFDGGSNKWVNGVMTATASGSIATFDNGGDDIPVSEFECEIVAQQASGTPTPDNPLAITGFSQADITVTDNDQITNLYTVAFGQTIYGGRLIYANGQWAIEVTHGYHEITGTENWAWAKSGTYTGGFYTPVSSVSAKANTPFICTHAKTVLSISDYAWGTCFCDGSFNFRIMQASDTIEDWKTYLANQYANGTPVSICFELATPTIIPLTSSTRIKTISGDNNIYSNTGDCEVKYFTNNADSLAELIKAFVV